MTLAPKRGSRLKMFRRGLCLLVVAGAVCGPLAAPAAGLTPTSTSAGSNPNPSVFGQPVTLHATVTPTSGTAIPTGTVTFSRSGTTIGNPVPLTASATASLQTATIPAGTSAIKAEYSGDANFTMSSLTFAQTVNPASTTLAVSSDHAPSVFGQTVTFTATVSPIAPGGGTPVGSVTFTVDGNPQSPVTVDGNGQASLATSSLLVAGSPHSVSVKYNDTDGNHLASARALTGGQTVNKADAQVSITSSLNPSTPGAEVTFLGLVDGAAPGAGLGTGSLTFWDGATQLGTVPLSLGSASISTSSLGAGPHTIFATYTGDSNINAGVDALDQEVTRPDTTPPVLTRYRLSRDTFAAASKGGSVGKRAAAAAKPRKPKVGTTVRYTLSEPATLLVRVKKSKHGHFVDVPGTFSVKGSVGKNKFKFTGRLKGGKLRPGHYKLIATARDAASNTAKAQRVSFEIVAR
jgi:Bacterial Ig-like domain (group 3)